MRSSSNNQNPWVQLYEARRVYNEPQSRPPGRPPALIPRRKVGVTLSQGEISELNQWQDRLSGLLGRKVSTGETIGILTRICTARLGQVTASGEVDTLAELVDRLIGAETNISS